MKMTQIFLKLISQVKKAPTAHAHCDVPCGIYDPHGCQLAALTVIRMVDIIKDNAEHAREAEQKGSDPLEFRHSVIRAVAVKEEHAENVKREIRVIWGDYFKPEHTQKYTELNELVHKIMQLGSKARQTIDRAVAVELLRNVNRFAEIFWETKNIKTKKTKAPYKPEEEVVYPVL
jgi:nickel superoxide dismutase